MNSDKKTRTMIVIITVAVLLLAVSAGFLASKLKHRESIEPMPSEDEA